MSSQNGRYDSLDVFRGVAIVAMVLVNNPGSWAHTYGPMRHAPWHGWTLTDLIFPFFLFIVGASAAVSLARQQASGVPSGVIIPRALFRSTKLFLLGLFLGLFYFNFTDPQFDWWQSQLLEMRIPGVLQRIAVVFFLSTLLAMWLKKSGLILVALILLAGYTLVMQLVSYTGPHGQAFSGNWLFANNLAAWLDHTLLGPAHVYYSNASPFTFDPEGILTTLPAVATCLTGVISGRYLFLEAPHRAKIIILIGSAIAMLVAAYLLEPFIPVNKALWTPSYVLLTSGLAIVSLVGLWWLTDVAGYRRWAYPFKICGLNSIAFYVLAGILARVLIMIPVERTSAHGIIYRSLFLPLFGPLNGSLAFAVTFLLICFIPIWWMYRRKIFLKV